MADELDPKRRNQDEEMGRSDEDIRDRAEDDEEFEDIEDEEDDDSDEEDADDADIEA